MRPRGPDGHRYPTYADAMAVLDPPATFENRPTYRPLDLSLIDSIGGAHLDLTAGRYFDSVSTAEALAHELAAALPNGPAGIGMDGLPSSDRRAGCGQARRLVPGHGRGSAHAGR
jgi:hypothetical protein